MGLFTFTIRGLASGLRHKIIIVRCTNYSQPHLLSSWCGGMRGLFKVLYYMSMFGLFVQFAIFGLATILPAIWVGTAINAIPQLPKITNSESSIPTRSPGIVGVIVDSPIPTPKVSTRSSVAGVTTQKPAPPQQGNKIECVGPDGKHFSTSQKECDDFNAAWGKPQTNDPMVTCGSDVTGYKKMRTSECDKSKACEVSPGVWIVTVSAEDCRNKMRQAQTVPQQQTQSAGNNVYCWNNTYNVGYYTTSGDKCNDDNFRDGVNKLCQNTQTIKLNGCNAQCQRELDENKAVCAWAYPGGNDESNNKYGECLNGAGGSGELYGVCLDKCNVQFKQDLGQCK